MKKRLFKSENNLSKLFPQKNSLFLVMLLVFIKYITINSSIAIAQIQPGIGVNNLPADNAPICFIPTVPSQPNGAGPVIGQMVQDFKLYEIDGTEHLLSDELSDGVPVLLISGSLTCPRFRDKIPDINNMSTVYGDALKIFIVYTVEAHPTTPSPYSGTIWLTSQNINAGILHPQPTTYGERKSLIDTLNGMVDIHVPILVDGPCNNWWNYFGRGANNAFLINPNGIVYAKHDWFNLYPNTNMYCSADFITSIYSGACPNAGTSGTFSYELFNDSTSIGYSDGVLSITSTIKNNSLNDFAILDIIKTEWNLPINWETALCADICYSADTDSIRIAIPPGSEQEFIFYFYTSSIADSGNVQVMFKNIQNSNNIIYQRFFGVTENSNSTAFINEHKSLDLIVYPNPTENYFIIQDFDNLSKNAEFIIYDATGKISMTGFLEERLDVSKLTMGKYLLFVRGENINASTYFIIH